jgi:hypothetical protein
MITLPLLLKVPMELWQVILLCILVIFFIAGVVYSIILGIGIVKQIAELNKKISRL